MKLYECLDCIFDINDVVAVGNLQTTMYLRTTSVESRFFTVVLKYGPLDVGRNSADYYEAIVIRARKKLLEDWGALRSEDQGVADDHGV